MTSRIKQSILAAAAAIVLSAGAANAASYDFSYTFNTGDVITGAFSGDGPITDITNITDVSGTYDGVALGPLAAWSNSDVKGSGTCGGPGCYSSTGAVISSNALDNNFVLFASSANSKLNYFYIIPWYNAPNNLVATQAELSDGTYVDYYNGQFIPSNWSVSVSAAPEPSAWALMFAGVALAGGALRMARRNKATLAAA